MSICVCVCVCFTIFYSDDLHQNNVCSLCLQFPQCQAVGLIRMLYANSG